MQSGNFHQYPGLGGGVKEVTKLLGLTRVPSESKLLPCGSHISFCSSSTFIDLQWRKASACLGMSRISIVPSSSVARFAVLEKSSQIQPLSIIVITHVWSIYRKPHIVGPPKCTMTIEQFVWRGLTLWEFRSKESFEHCIPVNLLGYICYISQP